MRPKSPTALSKPTSPTRLVLNIGGVSHFAIHNFKRAKELLTKAQEENQLIRELGGRYLDMCDEYQTTVGEGTKNSRRRKKSR